MKNFLLPLIILLVVSCGKKYETLYILNRVVEGYNEKTDIETVIEMTDEYFQIELQSVQGGKKFIAEFKKEWTYKPPYSKLEYIRIVDKDTSLIYFLNQGEFLNFMTNKGYEVLSQEQHKYGANYMFKRKK
jgi:hypothetical protein